MVFLCLKWFIRLCSFESSGRVGGGGGGWREIVLIDRSTCTALRSVVKAEFLHSVMFCICNLLVITKCTPLPHHPPTPPHLPQVPLCCRSPALLAQGEVAGYAVVVDVYWIQEYIPVKNWLFRKFTTALRYTSAIPVKDSNSNLYLRGKNWLIWWQLYWCCENLHTRTCSCC